MPVMSPWRVVQDTRSSTIRGIAFVGTASHGDLRLSKALAEKYLSKDILNRGIFYGGYYFYEEDCDWAIPCWYSFVIHVAVKEIYSHISEEKFNSCIASSINTYYPELLFQKKVS